VLGPRSAWTSPGRCTSGRTSRDASAFLVEQHNMTPEAAARLRADMNDHTGEDGVHYDSAAWFVTARLAAA